MQHKSVNHFQFKYLDYMQFDINLWLVFALWGFCSRPGFANYSGKTRTSAKQTLGIDFQIQTQSQVFPIKYYVIVSLSFFLFGTCFILYFKPHHF